jgi:predicted O-methyltransferase YrrM
LYPALTILGFVLFGASLYGNVRQRHRLLSLLGRNINCPIPTVRLDEFDPAFRSNELGPTTDAEVAFIGKGERVPGGTTDAEAWVLSVLSKHVECAFEFGTCTGKTAYLWARNSPPNARILTLTLAPEQAKSATYGETDSRKAGIRAEEESAFTQFLYSGTDVEAKITQLYGDSKEFDETPYIGSCDLIFIDGSHAYSYVESDTRKALKMIRPGGVIVWHDYRWPGGSAKGVYQFLNRLLNELPLRHLKGTNMVAFRSPSS